MIFEDIPLIYINWARLCEYCGGQEDPQYIMQLRDGFGRFIKDIKIDNWKVTINGVYPLKFENINKREENTVDYWLNSIRYILHFLIDHKIQFEMNKVTYHKFSKNIEYKNYRERTIGFCELHRINENVYKLIFVKIKTNKDKYEIKEYKLQEKEYKLYLK